MYANKLLKWLFLCYILAFRKQNGNIAGSGDEGGKGEETGKAKKKTQS